MSNNIYPSTSPYYQTDVINDTFLDFATYRPIPKLGSDVLYEVPAVYQYRPDLLAYDLYSDARLWWVFAVRNPNKLGADPYFNLVAGIQIYIPTIDTLKQVLGF